MSTLPEFSSIAERLAFLRARLGLTRAELEAQLRSSGAPRASVMTIRRNEAGDRSPTVEEIVALAALASVPPGWIIDGREEHPSATLPDERQQIISHLDAELMREAEGHRPLDAQAAFARVEDRLYRLRASGELSDSAWAYWLALREGAVHYGGYAPTRPADAPRGCSPQNTE